MCGITGFNWEDKDLIESTTTLLSHRGPDGKGYFIDDHVSLGHRRLAIIDTSAKGKQPMRYKNLTIVFNGEIFNFKAVKTELKGMGHTFISETDTEVILHAYDEWGTRCVEKFNGMWAFCIYDKRHRLLFLSRDRFGIKPCYYYHHNRLFIFASELKAISKHNLKFEIDPLALNHYFYKGYIGNDLTIYSAIKKILPGENITYYLETNKVVKFQYYHLEKEIKKNQKIPLSKRIESTGNIIREAVQDSLVADVPVGTFLSGGIDSSLVAAISANSKKHGLNTFSMGFTEKTYNELPFALAVSKHIHSNHHSQNFTISKKIIDEVYSHLDEPFGDFTLLPTYTLSKLTKKYVTVVLTGEGGDEVFGGYDTYLGYKVASVTPKLFIPLLRMIADHIPPTEKKSSVSYKFKRFVADFDKDPLIRHNEWMSIYNAENRIQLLKVHFIHQNEFENFKSVKDLQSLQEYDIKNYLVDSNLKKVDIASMLASLECRVPYLDYRLVPLILSLPEEYRLRNFKTKYLLKKFARDWLPTMIIKRKKEGFTAPLAHFINQNKFIKNSLTNKNLYRHNLLNFSYVAELLHGHIKGKENHGKKLWLVFVFNYWYKHYFESNS